VRNAEFVVLRGSFIPPYSEIKMPQNNIFSRRNLFRRSIGIRTLEDEVAPEKSSVESVRDDDFPMPPVGEDATPEKILKRIDAEPLYRLILQRLLAFCSEPRSTQEIYDELMYYPEMRKAAFTPKMLLSWMIEAGAIVRYNEKDTKTALWATTETGIEAIAGRDPAERLRRLMDEESVYADVYRMILEFCSVERSLSDIEYLLLAHPALQRPKVYPSYLVDRLEFAGALEWTGKWLTTETGKER